MRQLKYNEAINEALVQVMGRFKNTVCYGLGVPDPKNVFSTTKKLLDLFGSDRVFDTPTSENALTGIAAGIAAKKIKVIFSHQRVDFSLLSIDQLVNTLEPKEIELDVDPNVNLFKDNLIFEGNICGY